MVEKTGRMEAVMILEEKEVYLSERKWANSVWKGLEHLGSVQSLSRVRLFVTPWTAARQATLSITNSQSLLKLMSIESVMPSNNLILCLPLLFLPLIFLSIGVFSNESALHNRWPSNIEVGLLKSVEAVITDPFKVKSGDSLHFCYWLVRFCLCAFRENINWWFFKREVYQILQGE